MLNGDVPQAKRERISRSFRENKLQCLICTNVAARGLDFPAVDLIVQLSPPQETESYIHRSGRAGRAGKSGKSILLHGSCEQHKVRQLESIANIRFEKINMPQQQGANQFGAPVANADTFSSGNAFGAPKANDQFFKGASPFESSGLQSNSWGAPVSQNVVTGGWGSALPASEPEKKAESSFGGDWAKPAVAAADDESKNLKKVFLENFASETT